MVRAEIGAVKAVRLEGEGLEGELRIYIRDLCKLRIYFFPSSFPENNRDVTHSILPSNKYSIFP